MKKVLGFIALISLFSLTTSCVDDHFREEKVFAGGKIVSAYTLNKGKSIYEEYCMACHGVKGDGKGVAAKGMKVPPRDFTQGIFKFGRVEEGGLPQDSDFKWALKHGLTGSAMLPWDMQEGQMDAVIQYIKTFAPDVWEGKDKQVGTPIEVTKDPFGMAHRSSAIKKGKAVYHIVAQCQSCHRAYATYEELDQMSQEINGEPYGDFDEDLYLVKRQDTEWGFTNVPPDYTWHSVRSIRNIEDIYIRLAAGIAGTSMPAWKETLTNDEMWAVSYYVQSLMEIKDTPKRKELMDKLKAQ